MFHSSFGEQEIPPLERKFDAEQIIAFTASFRHELRARQRTYAMGNVPLVENINFRLPAGGATEWWMGKGDENRSYPCQTVLPMHKRKCL